MPRRIYVISIIYQDKSNIGRYSSLDIRDRGDTWLIPYDTIQSKSQRPHPATFPVKLPEMCLKLHGNLSHKTLVMNPFCGIGSSALACKKLGVSFVGFDVNQEYLEEAIDRIAIS